MSSFLYRFDVTAVICHTTATIIPVPPHAASDLVFVLGISAALLTIVTLPFSLKQALLKTIIAIADCWYCGDFRRLPEAPGSA